MTIQPGTSLADYMRVVIYAHFASEGVAPTIEQLAVMMKISSPQVRETLLRLAARRALVLDAHTGEIWMAAPFSAVPTRYRVHGATTSWWANCAWDMLGIPAAVGQSVRVDTTCPDCEESLEVLVDAEKGPSMDGGLVHFLVPASRWYDDIGFT